MAKKFEKIKQLPLRHDVVVGTVIASIIKTILRYLLMGAYLYACTELGLYDYGIIVKIVVTLTSICASRWILREVGRIVYSDMDEEPFQDVGIVACVRNCYGMFKRW